MKQYDTHGTLYVHYERNEKKLVYPFEYTVSDYELYGMKKLKEIVKMMFVDMEIPHTKIIKITKKGMIEHGNKNNKNAKGRKKKIKRN